MSFPRPLNTYSAGDNLLHLYKEAGLEDVPYLYRSQSCECFLLPSYGSWTHQNSHFFLLPTSHLPLISYFSKPLIMIVDKVQFSGYPTILMDENDAHHCWGGGCSRNSKMLCWDPGQLVCTSARGTKVDPAKNTFLMPQVSYFLSYH